MLVADDLDTLRRDQSARLEGARVPVYYHETIDPTSVREKEIEYLDTLGEVVTKFVNTPASDMRCVANWVVVWATGRWPQIVGQWEMRSWDWFTTHFANFKLEVDHPKGYEEYRHGGFDRLLVPHDGTPTLDEIVEGPIRAPWILQETVQVALGRSGAYLAELSESAEKVRAAERGIRLHGAYNVMLRNDSEVLVQWAFDELSTWVATVERPGSFPELRAWRDRAAGIERSHVGVLLRPTEWSPLR